MPKNIDEVFYKIGIKTRPVEYERWLTKEEAVTWLQAWRDQNVPKHNLYFSTRPPTHITSGVEYVYLNGMIDQLIEMIRNSDEDPVTTVAEYYYEMDEVLAMSDNDHYITHCFVGYMERASYEVLLFLKEKEKELNR